MLKAKVNKVYKRAAQEVNEYKLERDRSITTFFNTAYKSLEEAKKVWSKIFLAEAVFYQSFLKRYPLIKKEKPELLQLIDIKTYKKAWEKINFIREIAVREPTIKNDNFPENTQLMQPLASAEGRLVQNSLSKLSDANINLQFTRKDFMLQAPQLDRVQRLPQITTFSTVISPYPTIYRQPKGKVSARNKYQRLFKKSNNPINNNFLKLVEYCNKMPLEFLVIISGGIVCALNYSQPRLVAIGLIYTALGISILHNHSNYINCRTIPSSTVVDDFSLREKDNYVTYNI